MNTSYVALEEIELVQETALYCARLKDSDLFLYASGGSKGANQDVACSFLLPTNGLDTASATGSSHLCQNLR